MSFAQQQPIGVFDSGIGGLSVANAIYGLLPGVPIHYYADTAHVPYGPRPQEEIIQFSRSITQHLLTQGCQMIVVACNTATAAALDQLRQEWPAIPFVGMEPAVKPAAQATRNGRVGVLATASTIQSERYESLMHRYAQHVQVWEDPCTGLVPLIERGQLEARETRQILTGILQPLLEKGIDTLVLGCTHYPFIRPLLEKIVGPEVVIIDPAPAVARQVERVLVSKKPKRGESSPAYLLEASGPLTDVMVFTQIPFRKNMVGQVRS